MISDFLLKINFSKWWCLKATFTPDSRPAPTNANQFLWIVGFDRVGLIVERIYPRSTPPVSALYPWCPYAQITLFSTYPHPSGLSSPTLHDLPPTYSWNNYAHNAQYRTNPRYVCLISTPGLKWVIQANVTPPDSLMRVKYPEGAYRPYFKINPIKNNVYIFVEFFSIYTIALFSNKDST